MVTIQIRQRHCRTLPSLQTAPTSRYRLHPSFPSFLPADSRQCPHLVVLLVLQGTPLTLRALKLVTSVVRSSNEQCWCPLFFGFTDRSIYRDATLNIGYASLDYEKVAVGVSKKQTLYHVATTWYSKRPVLQLKTLISVGIWRLKLYFQKLPKCLLSCGFGKVGIWCEVLRDPPLRD
jgi:hypothetical protein